ncbi:MAG: septum formation initiator family protein [Aquificae bacterium]|nr:septum formation initiator family protein [Aquificota bacterium]
MPDFSGRLKRYMGMDSVLLMFVILFFIYFAYVILFGERNIFRLIQKEQYRNSLFEEVSKLKSENIQLEERINYLNSDTFFIEKRAREDLGLVKEGEEVYIIVDKENISDKKEKRWIDRVKEKYQVFHLR